MHKYYGIILIVYYLFCFVYSHSKQEMFLCDVALHVSRTGGVLDNNEVLLSGPVGSKDSGGTDIVSVSGDSLSIVCLLSDSSGAPHNVSRTHIEVEGTSICTAILRSDLDHSTDGDCGTVIIETHAGVISIDSRRATGDSAIKLAETAGELACSCR